MGGITIHMPQRLFVMLLLLVFCFSSVVMPKKENSRPAEPKEPIQSNPSNLHSTTINYNQPNPIMENMHVQNDPHTQYDTNYMHEKNPYISPPLPDPQMKPLQAHHKPHMDHNSQIYQRSKVPTNNRPIDNWPIINQPNNNWPINNQPNNNWPTNDRPNNNWPTNDRPINNWPTNDRPVYNWQTNDRPSNNWPNNNRPINTYSHTIMRHERSSGTFSYGKNNDTGYQNDNPLPPTQMPLTQQQTKVTSRSSSDMAHLSHNISAILENLLKNYNNQVRPGYHEGRTTVVKFSLLIRSMGPISEKDMKYSMECYMRQEWSDDRLRFQGPLKQLTLNIKMLEALWKPDTYFHNGLGSYVHMTTRPNKLIRINQNGDLLYSMRLTIKAKCPMMLRNFPMDKQSCPLVISSYGYTEKDVKYIWDKKLVAFTPGMGLSQFELLNTKCNNYSVRWRSGRDSISGMYSALQVNFNLSRSAGYFLIQVYVPCILIVVLSWVSFWINREATSDRVGLGITTVLTLSTISLDSRNSLPKVHYATALDWFILMSFGYCSATLLQFACVNFFTKVGSGEIQAEEDEWEDVEIVENYDLEDFQECIPQAYDISNDNSFDASVDDRHEIVFVNSNQHSCAHSAAAATLYATLNSEAGVLNHAGDSLATFKSTETQTEKKESLWSQCYHCVLGDERYRREREKVATLQRSVNSVSVIDTFSRVLFPLSYGLLNVWYWYSYYDTELIFNWTNPGFAHT